MSGALAPDEAAAVVNGRWFNGKPEQPLSAFSIDTRTLRSGDVFVALKTSRADGHAFLGAARAVGASAALVARVDAEVAFPQLVVADPLEALQSLARAHRLKFARPVVGVTGSFGKTTVKEMLGAVAGGEWLRTEGNLNNHIGVPLTLLRLRSASHGGAIVEAGINRAGEMIDLARMIQPEMAIITAVGPAHLEQLGDLQGVAREKAVLAQAVGAHGTVVIPVGLLQYVPFHQLHPEAQIFAVGSAQDGFPERTRSGARIRPCRTHWTEHPQGRGRGALHLELPGWDPLELLAGSAGMITNFSLVAWASHALGFDPAHVRSALASWQPFRQRGEILQRGRTLYYVDCYNANPGSMLDSAQRFANLYPHMPHLYVIGTMNELGSETDEWHRQTLGKFPLQADAPVCLVGEQAHNMALALAARGIDPSRIHTAGDAAELADRVSGFEGAVFLKGSRSLRLEKLVPEGGAAC